MTITKTSTYTDHMSIQMTITKTSTLHRSHEHSKPLTDEQGKNIRCTKWRSLTGCWQHSSMLLSGKPKRAIMFVPPHPPFSSFFCAHQPKWESQQLWPGWTLEDKASPSMQFLPSVRPLLQCTWKKVCCCDLTLCPSHPCRFVHIMARQ